MIVGILLTLTALFSMKLFSNHSKLDKIFAILLGMTGITAFFGAALRRATIMEYALIIAAVLGVIYLIVNVVRAIKNKAGKTKIAVYALCTAAVLCSMVLFGSRMITSAVTASGAEAYDNSVDFGIGGRWITIDRENILAWLG